MKKSTIFFKLGFILILTLTTMVCASQTTLLDSLINRYNSSTDVSERLTLLRSITAEEPNSIQKIEYANELLALAKEIKIEV